MKYFTRFIILIFIVCLTSLTSCRTMRTSEKAVSESETASVTASRLTFYRTLDSLSRQFHLSADSIIMIFATSPESPREFPSGMECLQGIGGARKRAAAQGAAVGGLLRVPHPLRGLHQFLHTCCPHQSLQLSKSTDYTSLTTAKRSPLSAPI